MKKLLYILLFLQIISGVFIFFMLIGSDAFTAVLAGFICILQIALTISVIRNTEDIEQLNEETTWLRTKLKGLENIVNPYNSPESAVPAAYHGEAARGSLGMCKMRHGKQGGNRRLPKLRRRLFG